MPWIQFIDWVLITKKKSAAGQDVLHALFFILYKVCWPCASDVYSLLPASSVVRASEIHLYLGNTPDAETDRAFGVQRGCLSHRIESDE
jgi:hypothetical protein